MNEPEFCYEYYEICISLNRLFFLYLCYERKYLRNQSYKKIELDMYILIIRVLSNG